MTKKLALKELKDRELDIMIKDKTAELKKLTEKINHLEQKCKTCEEELSEEECEEECEESSEEECDCCYCNHLKEKYTEQINSKECESKMCDLSGFIIFMMLLIMIVTVTRIIRLYYS